MRTTPALIALALALASTLTACGEDDGTVTVSPPPATVTVTEEPVLTDLPPPTPAPEPRLLTYEQVCDIHLESFSYVSLDDYGSMVDHIESINDLSDQAEPEVRKMMVPLRRSYYGVLDAFNTPRQLSASGRALETEMVWGEACYPGSY